MKISDVNSSLISTCIDWKDILVNRSFIRRNHTISWKNYSPKVLPILVRKSDINDLERMGQYSFQVIDDGGIFQIYYQFFNDDETLAHANLSYYGTNLTEKIIEEEFDLIIQEEEKIEDGQEGNVNDLNIFNDLNPVVPWLRIDYKPEDELGPLHHRCHMHFSLFQNARIPLSRVPTPRQFVEFVLAICYPHHYRQKRLNADNHYEPIDPAQLIGFNSPCFTSGVGNVFDFFPHIEIPSR